MTTTGLAPTGGAARHHQKTTTLPALPGVLTETGWDAPATLSFEEWEVVGQWFKLAERSVMWWIGDWLAFGEKKYGETYSQALEATDYENGSLRNAKWVSSRIEVSRRRENLGWSHHYEVASLAPAEQEKWLDKAEAEGWPHKELRAAIKRAPVANRAPLPEGKYGAIYADPPWRFETWSPEGMGRAAENHYPTMAQDEIEALPVGDLAADDCVLFLWAVAPQLPQALAVISAWGFEFKTIGFNWLKTTKDGEKFAMGTGYWTRANAEICLLATRGSPQRLNNDVEQAIVTPRGLHSEKPEEIAERIERLVPGPYIELFARTPRDGWHVWGNQLMGGPPTQQIEVRTARGAA